VSVPCKIYNHTGLNLLYSLDQSTGDLGPASDLLLPDGLEVSRHPRPEACSDWPVAD
jgi:hypothetical protein